VGVRDRVHSILQAYAGRVRTAQHTARVASSASMDLSWWLAGCMAGSHTHLVSLERVQQLAVAGVPDEHARPHSRHQLRAICVRLGAVGGGSLFSGASASAQACWCHSSCSSSTHPA
jgi:hypothetical protein